MMKICKTLFVAALLSMTTAAVLNAQTCSVTTSTIDLDDVLPFGVQTGDFNGDGFLDVFTIGTDPTDLIAGPPRVSVFANSGDGTFAAPIESPISDFDIGLAVGDLDGDSDLDVAFEIFSDGVVSVLLNNGDGSFGSEMQIPLMDSLDFFGPSDLTMIDVDGDSDLDIVVCILDIVEFDLGFMFPGRVQVLLNNGSGSFSFGSATTVGDLPIAIEAADVDSDSDLDLVVVNQNVVLAATPQPSASVSILLNDGSGLFNQTVIETDLVSESIAIDDFNSDGALDIVLTDAGIGDIGMLAGAGDGSFGSPVVSVISLGGTENARDTAVLDTDGDGDLDLVIPYGSNDFVVAAINDGSGSFEQDLTTSFGVSPVHATVGDFNGDSSLEVVIAHSIGSSLVFADFDCGEPAPILLGDVNLDEEVNLLDIAAFVDRITNNVFQEEADINEDDVVNLLDVGPFVDLLSGG